MGCADALGLLPRRSLCATFHHHLPRLKPLSLRLPPPAGSEASPSFPTRPLPKVNQRVARCAPPHPGLRELDFFFFFPFQFLAGLAVRLALRGACSCRSAQLAARH